MLFQTHSQLQRQTILQGANHRYYANVGESARLSIKTMTNGRAIYRTPRGTTAVDDRHYLILNEQQPYEIEIDGTTTVHSFCIFFPAGFAQQVATSFSHPTAHLLDNPSEANRSIRFFEQLYPHDAIVSPLLRSLLQQISEQPLSDNQLEESLYHLLAAMMQRTAHVTADIEQLSAARSATRQELYDRLQVARDYMHAHFDRPVSLDTIANVALLSPFHFLRSFKQAFHLTPHAYLTQLRVEQARFLLLHSDRSITDICFAVGFNSVGSFSSLFRKHSGYSPTAFRNRSLRGYTYGWRNQMVY